MNVTPGNALTKASPAQRRRNPEALSQTGADQPRTDFFRGK